MFHQLVCGVIFVNRSLYLPYLVINLLHSNHTLSKLINTTVCRLLQWCSFTSFCIYFLGIWLTLLAWCVWAAEALFKVNLGVEVGGGSSLNEWFVVVIWLTQSSGLFIGKTFTFLWWFGPRIIETFWQALSIWIDGFYCFVVVRTSSHSLLISAMNILALHVGTESRFWNVIWILFWPCLLLFSLSRSIWLLGSFIAL